MYEIMFIIILGLLIVCTLLATIAYSALKEQKDKEKERFKRLIRTATLNPKNYE